MYNNHITTLCKNMGMHYSLPVIYIQYIPYVPSSEEERKHYSHEQGSLKLHTSFRHVERSGTHHLRKTETYNYI